MINLEILEVSPIDVRYPFVDFIDISGSLYTLRSLIEGVEELEDLMEAEDLVMGMDGEEEVVPFSIDITKVSHGCTFPELHMSNPNTIDVYKDESKARIYIKTFMHLHVMDKVPIMLINIYVNSEAEII